MYNVDYFYNMLRMYSKTAEHICKVRWDFVHEAMPLSVLDFGSGCGFFKAFAPEGILVDTYDIMPVPITGITQDRYDLVTLWDVLEHIPDFNEIVPILSIAKYVAITVPIKPPKMKWEDFKHFKPLEHIHHFTQDGLVALMEGFGFTLIKYGNPECPPRQYIDSFLFKKVDNAKTDPR
jgi:hypothetical protein